jgi:hypothetical protein
MGKNSLLGKDGSRQRRRAVWCAGGGGVQRAGDEPTGQTDFEAIVAGGNRIL